jgi:hypothetical protein
MSGENSLHPMSAADELLAAGAAKRRFAPDPRKVEPFTGSREPDYFCQAYNAKRFKYCKARAGSGTDHLGTGRCSIHGGRSEKATSNRGKRRSRLASRELQARIRRSFSTKGRGKAEIILDMIDAEIRAARAGAPQNSELCPPQKKGPRPDITDPSPLGRTPNFVALSKRAGGRTE